MAQTQSPSERMLTHSHSAFAAPASPPPTASVESVPEIPGAGDAKGVAPPGPAPSAPGSTYRSIDGAIPRCESRARDRFFDPNVFVHGSLHTRWREHQGRTHRRLRLAIHSTARHDHHVMFVGGFGVGVCPRCWRRAVGLDLDPVWTQLTQPSGEFGRAAEI